ncbi:hypothetical protein [Rhodoferax antarcticus]|uniref:Uncharacterized protein n=1 Tax=Rhodoferax antarcticus ANT.BR TaxID=1111071 RepID=A0A1Q8YGK3_9BURK|nr:hypothetical protein [Rhodoferax antarcticus]APW45636.1 hypothetical protein RA876_03730 [Rhodoferax antarcticus]MCW2312786.1 hypothetical protein [Rhodoferax antarcticus]OLP07123.1 hypothetical protein BLL52_1874 [Rhodoferax antarcticus ANT.BR]
MNTAELITAHLNAPYGAVITVDDLAQSLRTGQRKARTAAGNAVLAYLFTELEPRLIVTCAQEVGANVSSAHSLYLDTLAHAAHPSPAWERAVADWL